MSLLTDADLTGMRETAAQALPGTAVIQTSGWASDGGGGGTTTWTNSGTVACRVAPLTGTEREIGDRIAADANFILTLPHDASITTNSRVITGGGTYTVEAIRDRSWEITTRAEAVKVV